jgi:UDP-N-acetylmuramoyl-tripeptide--D-alanyl-D-alanine ligase
MITLSLQKASEILRGTLVGKDAVFIGASNDTRHLQPGNLYIAIVGERVDGHDFLAEAINKGAIAALVSKAIDSELPQIVVQDTTVAMGELAKYWRAQFSIPVVGITGSCGKTTTSRMIGAILNEAGKTLVPEGNKNNQFGVPLTLFRLDDTYDYAVIEMGADRGGEIKYLANIVKPDVSVLTNVAPVHIEVSQGIGFGSIEGVYQEKTEIFRALDKQGIAIVNADDDYFPCWEKELSSHSFISFGYSDKADVTATDLHFNSDLHYNFTLCTPAGKIDINLSSLGKHNVLNALAASAVGLALNISLSQIQHALNQVPVVARRMIAHQLANNVTLIDDSYNSNVKSAKAVIDMMTDHAGIKIAVLGDMKEIGAESLAFHQAVGHYAKKKGIDYLLTLGPEAIAMANAFGDNAGHYQDINDLLDALKPKLIAGCIVVVKGSLSMGMDRIVNALI